MSRKVYVLVTTRLIFQVDEGVDINEVLENMEYDFENTCEGASLEGMEIKDWEITDSK